MASNYILLTIVSLFFQQSYLSVHGSGKLESYNCDQSSMTVSGLSAGGAMAMQFHVAFSEEINGAAIFAGLPFGCAKGGLTDAMLCMYSPGTHISIPKLVTEIDSLASSGKIDSTSNLIGKNVYVFHGTSDTTVFPVAGLSLVELYEHYGAKTQTMLTMVAVHGQPTDSYGVGCTGNAGNSQYIINCNYDGAYIGLNYLYNWTLQDTIRSVRPLAGKLLEFDQTEFGGGPASSMDTTGFVYIPSGCEDRSKKCKFHIAFHGCQQSKSNVGDVYATKAGYLEVAEANDIIVLFPQAIATNNGGVTNPNSCFDWWGYLNNPNFLDKDGAQMRAIFKMLERVAKCDSAVNCYEDSQDPSTTENPPQPGECKDNEVTFSPYTDLCDFYVLCACGKETLLHCAAGLYFDPSMSGCNFQQLVNCQNGIRF